MILFLWYLFTTPIDKVACSLWTAALPDRPALVSACGEALTASLERYTYQIVDQSGRVRCSQSGTEIFTEDCGLANLHQYRLNLVIEDYQVNLCTLRITHAGKPTQAEISAQCDPDLLSQYADVQLQLRFMGETDQKVEPAAICELPYLTAGDDIYQMTASPLALHTARPYELLEYRLRWLNVPESVTEWQNQYDETIWQAAGAARVPPKLLKNMIGVESQFWALWLPADAGEVGLLQVTDAGADIALRYSPSLHQRYCPQALDASLCSAGYALLSLADQQRVRDAYRKDMQCLLCTVYEAAEKTDTMIPIYAQTLAAFRCYAGEVPHDPATDIWDVTAALYHAGAGCVAGGICPQGLDYIQKIKLP